MRNDWALYLLGIVILVVILGNYKGGGDNPIPLTPSITPIKYDSLDKKIDSLQVLEVKITEDYKETSKEVKNIVKEIKVKTHVEVDSNDIKAAINYIHSLNK